MPATASPRTRRGLVRTSAGRFAGTLALLGLLSTSASGCFDPQGQAAATMETTADEDGDEQECLEELDAMCGCAETAGTPCSLEDYNRYEDACGDPNLQVDIAMCIDDSPSCTDAVAACAP